MVLETVNTETIGTFLADTDSTVTFAPYTPAVLGDYSVVLFTNTLTADDY